MENNINRRKFIKASSLTTAGLVSGLSLFSIGKSYGKNETIQLGVIGTGSRGTGLIRTIQEIANIRVIACCDVLPFNLEGAMKYADQKCKGLH
jgi:hypothetical protein